MVAEMPRAEDGADKDPSLRAHHRLLHRSCRGKAHGSGIAKQNNRRCVPPYGKSSKTSTSTISTKSAMKSDHEHLPIRGIIKNGQDSVPVNGSAPLFRKLSRNSTSSWEYSDSDSMHSSEAGQNGSFQSAESRSETSNSTTKRGNERSSNGDVSKEKPKGCCTPRNSQNALNAKNARGTKKRETWADSLRGSGGTDDTIKRLEEGWNDSSVIRTGTERKWRRITADIEQKQPISSSPTNLKIFGLRSSPPKNWNNCSKKILRRNRGGIPRTSKPIYDVIEWEELLELALARKIVRGGRRGRDGGVEENGGRTCQAGRDDGECMKRLEVLLEKNRVPPQNVEVRWRDASRGVEDWFSYARRSEWRRRVFRLNWVWLLS